ncbi:universal stress protein, partial [Rhizobium bangladeshense]|nr:universal stress protein [Rhizobium bangladeshense]MBX5258663.1 universal stress protein [Rhizobium sp. NLR16b]MBX5264756.1 universal stress protein [Rhizobium sp. NLR16a]MBX5313322.1 universal stress protein [Rhizobium sp. NLR11b]
MTIRTVLSILSVHQFEEDLKTAIDFCGAHGAHLNALVISLGTAPTIGNYNTISSVWLEERQREIDALSDKAAEIKDILDRSEISYEVQDVYTEFAWADE